MGKYKNKMFDIAENRVDTRIRYLLKGLITLDEAMEDLLDDPVVPIFFNKCLLSKIISFELRQGRTVQ